MLKRVFIHLSLILLFAFTQMGVSTHAISHIADSHEQHQQDQSNAEHQCGQCISLSHVADAISIQAFNFTVPPAAHTLVAASLIGAASTASFSYSARAPPHHSQA